MMQLAVQLLRFPITLGVAYFVLTAMLWWAPGRDLDSNQWGRMSGAEAKQRWRSYGDFSLWYATELLHGRAGESTQFETPVVDLIVERAPLTFKELWRGFAAAWLVAVLAGIASHFWPWSGRLALACGSLLLSLPTSFVLLTLILSGVAPWIGLAVCLWPKTHAYWETMLQTGRRHKHLLAFLAQGAGPWRAQWFAIWRPQARQLFGLIALTVPFAVGATIPMEVLADQPGLGQLAWRAVGNRDLPLLTSVTLLFTAATCLASLVAEWLSPEQP